MATERLATAAVVVESAIKRHTQTGEMRLGLLRSDPAGPDWLNMTIAELLDYDGWSVV